MCDMLILGMRLTRRERGSLRCPSILHAKSEYQRPSFAVSISAGNRPLTHSPPLHRTPRFAPTIGKKLTQKECQQQSDLGPKLFRRSLDLCRFAKDLDESKINFASLVRQFGGNEAQDYMDVIYKHFKKSCFDAGIVSETTWDANHILVVCAIYCWVCDRVFPVSLSPGIIPRSSHLLTISSDSFIVTHI